MLRSPGRWLVVAFAATLAAFVTSTAASAFVVRHVRRRSLSISQELLPAIEALSMLRGSTFRGEILVRRAREAPAQELAAVRRDLQKSLNELQAQRRALAALPPDGSHRAALERLDAALSTAIQGLQVASGAEGAPDPAIAERTVAALVEARAEAHTLIDADVARASEDAAHIARSNRRAMHIALALDTLSALLMLALSVIAWRAVTDHMRMREAQERMLTERAAELEAFAGRVAHDILNPLGAVSLSLQLLHRRWPDEVLVKRGGESLKRAQGLVSALLDFARAGSRPDPGARCEVSEVLAGVVADQAEVAARAGIEVSLQAQPVRAACAPGVLASVVGNLLANAIKYMGAAPVRQVRIQARGEGARVAIEVADTGPGIPSALLGRIFEPFVRGPHHHEPGIGLGLSTVKKLCEAHGGRIAVHSTAGQGARFSVELPQAPAET